MKKQVILIHGGDPYDTYEAYLKSLRGMERASEDFLDNGELGWRDRMHQVLGDKYEVFNPEMPNWMNAKYLEWEIWFEKMLKHVRPGAIFVGHSLGGIFLAKYFATHDDHGIGALFMTAAPFTQKEGEGMADFVLPTDLSRLARLGPRVHLYHSEDDPVVAFGDLARYKQALPQAHVRTFKTGGHFRMAEFPELVGDIKAL